MGENESEVSDKPNVKWEDVAGLDAAKEACSLIVRQHAARTKN